MLQYPEVTGKIVEAALKVHSAIGPGVLESVYQTCMAHELRAQWAQGVDGSGAPGDVSRHPNGLGIPDRFAGRGSYDCGVEVCRLSIANP